MSVAEIAVAIGLLTPVAIAILMCINRIVRDGLWLRRHPKPKRPLHPDLRKMEW